MDDPFNKIDVNILVLFSLLGLKSKGLKSKGYFKIKGHSMSKGFKALNGTKAKSDIHKGLAKRSAEPGLGWSWSRGFYWKGHGKGKSFKGKWVYLRLLDKYL